MIRQNKKSTSSLDEVHRDVSPTPEQFNRVAELVANGELPFPEDLSAERSHRLLNEVQQRRRCRLVKFIAHTIAMDILRSRDH